MLTTRTSSHRSPRGPGRVRRGAVVAAVACAAASAAALPGAAAAERPRDASQRAPLSCERLLAWAEGADLTAYRLQVVPVSGGLPTVPYDGPQAELDPDFSPDGRRLAFATRTQGPSGPVDTALQVLDLATGDVRTLLRQPQRALRYPEWSPDGRTLAYVSGVGGTGLPSALHLVPADAAEGSGDRIIAVVPAGEQMFDLAWHPRGHEIWFTSRVALPGDPYHWRLWSVAVDGTDLRLRDDSGSLGYAQLHRDGRRMVVEGDEPDAAGVRRATLYRTTTALDRFERIPATAADQWGPALSSDGRRAAFLDDATNEIRVVPVAGGAERVVVPGDPATRREGLSWQPVARCVVR